MAGKLYPVTDAWRGSAYVNDKSYKSLYDASISDPEGFWRAQASRIDWLRPFSKVKNTSFGPEEVSIKWFEDGTLNVCANCVDRHLATRGDQVAILWEGDDPSMDLKITYRQLHERVSRLRKCAQKTRRQKRRSRYNLPSDGPRGGVCHARLRSDWGNPLRSLWRLLSRQLGEPHLGLRFRCRYHSRRRHARRPQSAA